MPVLPLNSPYGLPLSPSPRVNHAHLTRLDTNTSSTSSPASSRTTSPYSASDNEKGSPAVFIDTRQRRRSSLIFANATIPLSPASSISREYAAEKEGFEGLAPRKRSGLARLFCCFGREERARRRAMRFADFEQVGEDCHWTEL
ncbi:hypothetical protein BDV95DRAFT_496191 [Massariosphaeria phaeospora]|uniref:Uncharacterized protein n=1 Tax=Massariosphaeria phaeospora TaxID=100035 RepID=A0A7C8M8P6_9PLEO|nr:hypothetical protein BDV95DRAFT_496191 [Massariosphaeria phaeospora]